MYPYKKLFLYFTPAIFVLYFLGVWYLTGSIKVGMLAGLFFVVPLVILGLAVFFTKPKRTSTKPYIIGDSNKVEYLTSEELEKRLKN
ncbi:hypothetical protein [Thermococcus sp.]